MNFRVVFFNSPLFGVKGKEEHVLLKRNLLKVPKGSC